MVSDVVFADQYCYINDINRYHAVCYGLSNAKKIFEKTFSFQYRLQLTQEATRIQDALAAGKLISDPDFPQFPYQWARINERLIDCFLIGTFFEIVAKAFLLDKGYIVHQLHNSNTNADIKELARIQKTTPIKIADLLVLDHFQDYKKKGRNGLESLQFKTIDYEKLYKNDFEKELGFDKAICSLGRYYRIERNMIHFPLAGASENQIDNPESANVQSFDHTAMIVKFIEKNLIPLFERRNQEYKFRMSLE